MTDSQNTGFEKFVPGFDFLQNLAKGTSQAVPQMPNLANWIAPTLDLEELEKRIGELKAVHFWLEQNSRALGATVQALEVQKMTLATLKGMNFNVGDVASAFKPKAADSVHSGIQRGAEANPSTAKTQSDAATGAQAPARKAGKPSKPAAATALIDPMQLWGALTQQFQQIAAGAMKDAGKTTAMDPAAGFSKAAHKTKKQVVTTTAKTGTAPKKTSRKTVRKTPRRGA